MTFIYGIHQLLSTRNCLNENFGFAYEKHQDDYKVVGIFPIDKKLHRVEVCSLTSDSWRRTSDFKGRKLLYRLGKLVNGKLHWFNEDWNIISFDLAEEKWTEIENLCNFHGYNFLELGVFGSDLLCFVITCGVMEMSGVIKEYGVKESWTKMFTIKDDPTRCLLDPPIFVSNEGEVLLQSGSSFRKYNLKDDSSNFHSALCSEAEVYVKSVVCPLSEKEQGRRLKQLS